MSRSSIVNSRPGFASALGAIAVCSLVVALTAPASSARAEGGAPSPAALTGHPGTAAATGASSGSGATAWTWANSPNLKVPAQDALQSVACVSASDCWAVGWAVGASASSMYSTLIEHYDGTKWAIDASPSQPGALQSVACASATECWAVGDPGIERYDGKTWSLVDSPTVVGYLYGVTCVSANECWAVGTTDYQSDGGQAVVYEYTGSGWSLSSIATPSGAYSELRDATCVSPTDCWAVGSSWATYNSGGAFLDGRTLIEYYDGSSWSIVISPNPTSVQDNTLVYSELASVSCAAADDCSAVGTYCCPDNSLTHTSGGARPLMEHYDGTDWTIASAAGAPGGLWGVTCAHTAACWAVGSTEDSLPLIYQGRDITWSYASYYNVAPSTILRGVTCVSTSDCWAVGSTTQGGGADVTFIERYGPLPPAPVPAGSWRIGGSPNAPGSTLDYLYGIACPSPGNCWTVGESRGNNHTQGDFTDSALVEHYDSALSSRFQVVPSPAVHAQLHGISCVSSSDCWAVGYYWKVGSPDGPALIEHYDGSSWQVVAAAGTGNGNDVLQGVACASATECWAVGSTANGSIALIERFDGTAWRVAADSAPGALQGVTCVTTTDCWAVGNSGTAILAEHYDGTSWRAATSGSQGQLQGVSCTSASDCWAVGWVLHTDPNSGNSSAISVIVHYDGRSWKAATPPALGDPNRTSSPLHSVACLAASNCWAVGYYNNPAQGNTFQSLLEHYAGKSWTVVPSQNTTPFDDNYFYGIGCDPGATCWAVGAYQSNGSPTAGESPSIPNADGVLQRTLVEHNPAP